MSMFFGYIIVLDGMRTVCTSQVDTNEGLCQ